LPRWKWKIGCDGWHGICQVAISDKGVLSGVGEDHSYPSTLLSVSTLIFGHFDLRIEHSGSQSIKENITWKKTLRTCCTRRPQKKRKRKQHGSIPAPQLRLSICIPPPHVLFTILLKRTRFPRAAGWLRTATCCFGRLWLACQTLVQGRLLFRAHLDTCQHTYMPGGETTRSRYLCLRLRPFFWAHCGLGRRRALLGLAGTHCGCCGDSEREETMEISQDSVAPRNRPPSVFKRSESLENPC
jgi:hypothetical protein